MKNKLTLQRVVHGKNTSDVRYEQNKQNVPTVHTSSAAERSEIFAASSLPLVIVMPGSGPPAPSGPAAANPARPSEIANRAPFKAATFMV